MWIIVTYHNPSEVAFRVEEDWIPTVIDLIGSQLTSLQEEIDQIDEDLFSLINYFNLIQSFYNGGFEYEEDVEQLLNLYNNTAPDYGIPKVTYAYDLDSNIDEKNLEHAAILIVNSETDKAKENIPLAVGSKKSRKHSKEPQATPSQTEWHVILSRSVLKDLKKLPADAHSALNEKIQELKINPYAVSVKSKTTHTWHVRLGYSYRATIDIDVDAKIVIITRIGATEGFWK